MVRFGVPLDALYSFVSFFLKLGIVSDAAHLGYIAFYYSTYNTEL